MNGLTCALLLTEHYRNRVTHPVLGQVVRVERLFDQWQQPDKVGVFHAEDVEVQGVDVARPSQFDFDDLLTVGLVLLNHGVPLGCGCECR